MLARYVGTVAARATAATFAVAAALLTVVDALDPSAGANAPGALGDALPRALWLAAVGAVVALALAPAVTRSVLARGGAGRALRAAGADDARVLVAPMLVLALAGAAATGGLATLAARASEVHPGHRPQPLDVVPWGAAHAGDWTLAGDTAVFAARRGAGVRAEPVSRPAALEVHAVAAAHGGPTRGAAGADRGMAWLLAVAALGAAPMALAVAGAARRGRVAATWAGSVVALLVLVAGVVGTAHARAVLHAGAAVAGSAVVGAALAGAAAGRAVARGASRARPPQ